MSGIYRAARTALWEGQLDVVTGPVGLALVGPGYTYDPDHTTTADLTAVIATAPVTITNIVDGEVQCDPVTFVAIAETATVAGLVTFINDGGQGLIGFVDRRADSVPVNPTAGSGGDMTFTFVDYLLKI